MREGSTTEWFERRWVRWLCWLVTAIAVLGAGVRAVRERHVAGPMDVEKHGFYDFNHGLYYPCRAFANHISPYGLEFTKEYPVDTPIPEYSPSVFVLHLPLALPPLPVAQGVCFALVTLLLLGVARATADAVEASGLTAFAACLIALSRGGHGTLVSGYFTLELVLGAILALQYAERRPWLAAAGFLLAASKPNYALPLLVCLLARGNYRAALRGGLVSAIGGGIGLAWLAWGRGLSHVLEDYRAYSAVESLAEAGGGAWSVYSWISLDLLAAVSKWLALAPTMAQKLAAMTVMLVPVIIALWRLKRSGDNQGAATPSGAIAALAMLVTIHHQFYDAVLLAPAIAGLLLARPAAAWTGYSAGLRWTVGLLALTPSLNLLSTRAALTFLEVDPGSLSHKTLTSLNAVALTLALVLLIGAVMWRSGPRPDRAPGSGDG